MSFLRLDRKTNLGFNCAIKYLKYLNQHLIGIWFIFYLPQYFIFDCILFSKCIVKMLHYSHVSSLNLKILNVVKFNKDYFTYILAMIMDDISNLKHFSKDG